jgi:hypothetical protein
MHWLSRHILFAADLQAVADARRRNYTIFHERIVENSRIRKVFGELPGDACPWVFPIIMEGRELERLDYQLRDQGVPLFTFGSTLHPLVFMCDDPLVVGDARFLADNLVCLSIHQDIEPAQIEWACARINFLMQEP